MRVAWAAQGPGPVTLAYRSSINLRYQHTVQAQRPRGLARPKTRASGQGPNGSVSSTPAHPSRTTNLPAPDKRPRASRVVLLDGEDGRNGNDGTTGGAGNDTTAPATSNPHQRPAVRPGDTRQMSSSELDPRQDHQRPSVSSQQPPTAMPYTRTSKLTLDRLEMTPKHQMLLRARHQDQAIPSDPTPICLPPPPAFRPIANSKHLDGLRDSIREENLLATIDHYAKLSVELAVDQLAESDLEDISEHIAYSIRSEYAAMEVGKMLTSNPESFGYLSEMALHAAVRDHWQGLYRLMLALVRIGQPGRVVSLNERYRKRLRVHQGRSPEHLRAWDRELRMASRVSAEGIKPISTVKIAALVMLDQFNALNALDILGTTTNWRGFDPDTVSEVNQCLSTVRRSDTTELKSRFKKALDRFLFMILCHHPNALKERLITLYKSNVWTDFEELWEEILTTTTGKDRMMRPLELDFEFDQLESVPYEDLVLGPQIWYTFIDGFAHFGRPHELYDLVTKILPERGLKVPALTYARTRTALTLINRNSYFSEETRRVAAEYSALLHRKALVKGFERVDEYFAACIEIDNLLSRLGNVNKAYDRLRAQGVNIGKATRASLAAVLCERRDFKRAEQVLGWTLGDPKIAQPTSSLPFRRFVMALDFASPDFPSERIVRAIKKRPKGCEIDNPTQIMIIMRAAAQNPTISFDHLMKALLDITGSSIAARSDTIQTVLNRGRRSRPVTPLQARVAVELLRDHLTHHSHSHIQSRIERMWGRYMRPVVLSVNLTPSQRNEFIREAVAILEEKYGTLKLTTYFSLVDWYLARRHPAPRPGKRLGSDLGPERNRAEANAVSSDQDTMQAMYWWNRMRHIDIDKVPRGADHEEALRAFYARNERYLVPEFWTKMMFALKNAGRIDHAANVVADAWEGEADAEDPALREYRVAPSSPFWKYASDAGMLDRVGLSKEDLDGARSLWSKGKTWDVLDIPGKRVDSRREGEEESLDEMEERLADEGSDEGPDDDYDMNLM